MEGTSGAGAHPTGERTEYARTVRGALEPAGQGPADCAAAPLAGHVGNRLTASPRPLGPAFLSQGLVSPHH